MANVVIKRDGRIDDVDCRKTLSKVRRDTVTFIAAGEGPWTIYFPPDTVPGYRGSPFTRDTYNVTVGNPVTTSDASGGVAGLTYKYQVKNAANEVKDDPDILIDD